MPELVGDDPLQADDVPPRPPARQEKPVEVDAHDHVRDGGRPGDADVVEVPVERVEARPNPERADEDLVARRGQAGRDGVEADEGAAALRHGERGGGEEREAHYRPWNLGGRFSRNARVPSL